MSRVLYRWTSLILAVMVCVATVVRVGIANPDRLKTYGMLHYSLHVMAFAAIAIPGALGFPRGWRWLGVVLCVAVLGWCTEFYEHVAANNPMEWDDVTSNALGSLLGVLMVKAWLEDLASRRPA